jgi:predicted ATPase
MYITYRALADKNMAANDMQYITEDLAKLAKRDILEVKKPEPDLTYQFKHSMIRETAYNMMLFSQRRKCHAIIAQHLEHNNADNDDKSGTTFAAIIERYWQIAYHYDKASITASAVEYFEKAGNIAQKGFANEEVIQYLEKAIQLGGDLKR